MTSMRYIILSVAILVLLLASHFHPTSAHQHEHEDRRVLTSLGRRILSLPTEFDTDNSSKIRVQIKKRMRFVPSSAPVPSDPKQDLQQHQQLLIDLFLLHSMCAPFFLVSSLSCTHGTSGGIFGEHSGGRPV
ncbi:hypothetical protein LOK49_LG03G03640 [Camellia lanceoleosa]|uniref:Uncharacterized protein n=1 Tax=Camellia lanceoleosa TaxID=1840588 RepID=A0ACC0IEE5_9ERIC|nr:hypothetical protein LOK49_LG03G03640 [Camellia lanceoleosa]